MFQLDSALFPVYPVAFKRVITKCLSWPLSSARGGNDFIRIDIVAAEMIYRGNYYPGSRNACDISVFHKSIYESRKIMLEKNHRNLILIRNVFILLLYPCGVLA